MSVDESQPELGPSRLPRSNSVEACTSEIRASDEIQSYEEQVAAQATECVEAFREEYPYLANLPLSERPGQKLRAEVVDVDRVEEHVEEAEYLPPEDRRPSEPDKEWDSGFTVERVERAEPVTWAEALYQFLTTRQAYDDGLGGRFVSIVDGETFTVDFNDCWTAEYGDEQAAKNAAFQRQLMGGTYPDNEHSARAGEHVEDPEWSGDTATILTARTGSSKPNGKRIPPVDHAHQVARTWSDGGVYHVVRNACEYHLGLDSDQWGFVRGDDVHGLGDDHDTQPGVNACHVHSHDAIYIDLGATGLRDEFETDEEIVAVLESLFYPAIEKHVEACDLAGPEAHTREKAIEVRLDLEEPAGYATEYLRLNDETPMMEQPPELQAFAAVEWAMNRRRVARSKVFNDAAKADLCLQDKDRAHGHRLTYNSQGDVVCAHCGSAVGIDADTIAEYRLSGSGPSAAKQAVADGGHEHVVGVEVGEGTDAARVRSLAKAHVEAHGEPHSVARLMGRLGVDPRHRDVIEEVLAGVDSSAEVRPVYGDPPPLPPEYELVEILKPDGTAEPAGGGGGGVRLEELVLPEQRLLRETRLKYVGECGNPPIRCEKTGVSMYSAESMAGHLVHECGVREPWHAEVLLSFEDQRGDGVPAVFDEPVSHPPVGVR